MPGFATAADEPYYAGGLQVPTSYALVSHSSSVRAVGNQVREGPGLLTLLRLTGRSSSGVEQGAPGAGAAPTSPPHDTVPA